MNFILGGFVSKTEFDSLKETMQMFQDNIEKNIDWFYAGLAIVSAVLIVGLYFLVKTSVSIGIEKGIEKTNKKIETLIKESQQFKWSTGAILVSNKKFQIILPDLHHIALISFEVIDISSGLYLEKKVKIDDNGVISVELPQIQGDGEVFWRALWVPKQRLN